MNPQPAQFDGVDYKCPMDLLDLANRLADAASDVVHRYFRTPHGFDSKDDDSPVTIADREAEKTIRDMLAQERPNDGIQGEEFGLSHEESEWRWIIDPIDGTKAFVTGRPTFVNLIALTHNGTPVLGLINQPMTGDRWLGASGHPTFFNGQACSVRDCPGLGAAILATTTPEMFTDGHMDRFDALAGKTAFNIFGGDGYSYGQLASGFLDIVIEAQMKVHDYAALVPVVEGAGGVITDFDGKRLGLGSGDTVLAAGTPELHKAALDVLKSA